MGKRGPKPKPKALRVFEGDPGHLLVSRHDGEVEPPKGSERAPPEYLGEYGLEQWRELSPTLYRIGLLTDVDWNAFAIYCQAWDQYRAAVESLESGYFPDGKIHPAVKVKKDAVEIISKYSAQFGLTPVARIGLHVDGHSQQDDLEAFKTA